MRPFASTTYSAPQRRPRPGRGPVVVWIRSRDHIDCPAVASRWVNGPSQQMRSMDTAATARLEQLRQIEASPNRWKQAYGRRPPAALRLGGESVGLQEPDHGQ